MAHDLIRFMQSLFPQAAKSSREIVWRPPTDVYRTRYGWLLKFDLAGVRPEDFEVRVSGSRLIVRGTRRDWCLEEGCLHYRMEISYSHFERSIELPGDLEQGRVTTELRHGLLLVRIHTEADE
jgi:HSP20 family protein